MHARIPTLARPATRLPATVLPAALMLLAACSPDAAPEGATTLVQVRDSAGVRIVEHPPAEGPPVAVPDSAVLALGQGDDPDYLFASIMGLVALDGGRVAVGESDGTIRIFGPDGTLERRTGGNGEGPGEFAFLGSMTRLAGDTLGVPDGRRGRTQFFTPSGDPLRETQWSGRVPSMPEGASGCVTPNVWDVFDDGALLMMGYPCVFGTGEPGPRDYRADLLIVDDDTVTEVETITVMTVTEDPSAEEPFMRFVPPPVYGRPALAAHEGRILVALPFLGLRIRALRPDGSVAWDLRDATPERPLTPDLQRRIEESWSSTQMLMYDEPVWPETLEGWDTLKVTADGAIWARSMKPWPDPAGEIWTRFSADGTARSRWQLPAGFTLHDVRDGLAWGVTTDEMGVEEVVALPLPE